MLKFGLKLSLKLNSSAKTEFKTKLNQNNPVLNQTCKMHLDRPSC